MSKQIIILFDLDGTLIDSRKDLTIAVNKTLSRFGIEELADETILKYVGNGIRSLLYDCAKDNEHLKEMIDYFISFYSSHLTDNTKPYSGVQMLLEQLKSKGIKMGVVTNKMTALAKTILHRLKMTSYFDELVGGDLYQKKPHPEPLLRTAAEIGYADRIIVVGDSENDIIAGKLAEFETAGALWGLRPAELIKQLKPDFALSASTEVLEIL